MAAFSEAPLFERLAQIFQHAGAAAQHDAIGLDVQRQQTDVYAGWKAWACRVAHWPQL